MDHVACRSWVRPGEVGRLRRDGTTLTPEPWRRPGRRARGHFAAPRHACVRTALRRCRRSGDRFAGRQSTKVGSACERRRASPRVVIVDAPIVPRRRGWPAGVRGTSRGRRQRRGRWWRDCRRRTRRRPRDRCSGGGCPGGRTPVAAEASATGSLAWGDPERVEQRSGDAGVSPVVGTAQPERRHPAPVAIHVLLVVGDPLDLGSGRLGPCPEQVVVHRSTMGCRTSAWVQIESLSAKYVAS